LGKIEEKRLVLGNNKNIWTRKNPSTRRINTKIAKTARFLNKCG